MDELAMFEMLRPDEPGLAAGQRDRLRAEIFGGDAVEAGDGVVTPLFRATGRHGEGAVRVRRSGAPANGRSWKIAVAAVALVAVGVGGTWALVNRRAPEAPALAPPSSSAVDDASPTPAPRVRIDAPGWRLTHASDTPLPPPALVLFDPVRRLAGPSIRIDRGVDGSGQSLSTVVGQVQLGPGVGVGTLSVDGDRSLLEWTDSAGTRWFAESWRVDRSTLTEAAGALTVDTGGAATIARPPAGLVVAPPDVTAAFGSTAEYLFTRDDGTTLQINLYPGGAAADAMRSSDDPADRADVVLGSERVSLETYHDADDGRFRANLGRGFWAWELDGEPFVDQDDFLNTVAAVHVIDETTWAATLPATITAGGAARQAAVEQLLTGVPVPDGFDAGHRGGTADRSTLIVQTSGAVACAWLDQWFDAGERGDTTAAARAAAALATSRQWPMLLEVIADGYWAQMLWRFADAVNGGPGIDTGNGLQPPTRQLARDGLGCTG